MTAAWQRDPAVAGFLAATEAAVLARAAPGSEAARTAREVFARSRARVGAPGGTPASRLPVCDRLGAAEALPRDAARAAVMRALRALSGRLSWARRASIHGAGPDFADGHANAMILGPGGLEERDDLRIGVTLMAPGVTYPLHDHPPEEVYLALTPGEWWNARMDWTDPGPRGLIYNPPGIRHAMRSGATPFVAVWLLPG